MTPAATAPTVLVVDDESSILQTLEILLRGEGFTPVCVLGGKAALERLPQLRPDIVLTDVRMPQVDGVEVLGAARAADPEVPVILMTAWAGTFSSRTRKASSTGSTSSFLPPLPATWPIPGRPTASWPSGSTTTAIPACPGLNFPSKDFWRASTGSWVPTFR